MPKRRVTPKKQGGGINGRVKGELKNGGAVRTVVGLFVGALLMIMFNYATKVGDVREKAATAVEMAKSNGTRIEALAKQTQSNKDEIKREVWFLQQQLADTRKDVLEALKKK